MHEQKLFVRYFLEMLGAFLLYAVVLVASIQWGRSMSVGWTRTVVLFSPMVPVILIMAAVVRYFRRVDEYMRLTILENWAVTGAITAFWTFTYGFLETAGWPRLSLFVIFPAMGVTSGLLFFIRRVLAR